MKKNIENRDAPISRPTTFAPVSVRIRKIRKGTSGDFERSSIATKAPISAANFLHYVDQKKLDGITFYRTCKVADKFGFVQFGTNGDPKRTLPPIKHEPTTITGLKHLNGTLSTARLAPGSARGDFTISVGDQPSFDADPTKPDDALKTNLGYAAFGRVVDGMDVVLELYDEKPISVQLPEQVEATIVEADAVVKGQTASSSYKPAMLDNGVRVMVPPHIGSGTRIIVDVYERTYVGKVG